MKLRPILSLIAMFGLSAIGALGQSTATLTGTVTDPTGAVVPNVQVKIHSVATSSDRTVVTDSAGIYVAPSLQPGDYNVEATATGFSAFKVEKVTLNLDQHVTINMKLAVSSAGETVEVEGGAPVIETADTTVGQVIDKQTVQEIPLNGRHFLDLTVLTPGGVTGPANANLTAPSRGVGAFSFLTAGNRDDSVNFQINGINLNDIANAQIVFQPSINTTSEVKIINSSPSAEYGRNSGSVTNVSTRSGTNKFHGEVFDYLRNNSFDARNFFNPKGTSQIALKRNNFGGAVGGPIFRNKAFFFASYEALRQHQGLPVNTAVLSASDQAGVTDPISLQLLKYIPLGNIGNLFQDAINGPVNIDQGTLDLLYLLNAKDTIHAFYANQHDIRTEPTTQGNTLPGFGDHRPAIRQILTINETHLFTSRLVNELRLGYNRVHVEFQPNFTTDPSTLGFHNFPAGVKSSGGIPQTTISGYGINIGGPSGFPQGRYDTLGVVSNATTYTVGKHSVKFGAEVRRFLNANFSDDPGTLGFVASPALTDSTGKIILTPARTPLQNFQLGLATSFSITPQATTSRIFGNAVGAFIMDTFKATQRFTLEYGFRFEWIGSPTYGNKQAAVFDPVTVTLGYYGTSGPASYQDAYKQNYNYMPRLGFIYDVFGNGKSVVRGGYSIMNDQPLAGLGGLSGNPPFTSRVSYTASTTSCVQGASGCNATLPLAQLYASAAATAISVSAVQPNYKNATTQSFNLNVQHELPWKVAVSLGYYGSVGRHLRMGENINQYSNPATQLRPLLKLAANSPILPGASINTNITETVSNGQSNYNGMWLNFRKETNKGLTLNATYQYTKSLDLGSTAGTQYTDITQPFLNYARSDFDTRNRISGNAIYLLPFKGNRFVEGFQVSGIVQWQTGNPLNLTTTSAYNGTASVQHPILETPIHYAKQYVTNAVYWFAPGGTTATPGGTVCTTATAVGCTFFAPTNTIAGMGRNGATGPGFADFDTSISKTTSITEAVKFQLKVDIFDLFNHASFSNPGTSATANSTTFGVITATRFPVGDLGSSRQLQLSGKITF